MKQSKISKLAYTAGMVDADGCILIEKRYRINTRSKSPIYRAVVEVSQNDGRIIDWLYGNFGGTVRICKPYRKQIHNQYYWVLTHRKASQLLKQLVPFLIRKKWQAQLAIQLQSRLDNTHKHLKGKKRTESLSQHELVVRDKLIERIKLDKREIKRSLAAETKRSDSS